MGLNLQYEYGQTPLEAEELEGIKIATISTKAELDEWEQQNIEEALLWAMNKKWKIEKILSEVFINDLHKRMYKNIWKWAGNFRKTEKNIGVVAYQIPTALRQLLDDAQYWYQHQIYAPDELALRFKHRLVSIHCFPNGNGRHSRLMADIIIEKIFGLPVFTWGRNQTGKDNPTIRTAYITAVKAGDRDELQPLLAFARS